MGKYHHGITDVGNINRYYNKCSECEKSKQLRRGEWDGKEVCVDDCIHRGNNKEFEANGFICMGYKPKDGDEG